jgi:sorting nexin-29
LGSETSDTFITHKGLRQGDVLACNVFNLALEKIVRDANVWPRGTIYNKSTQLLAYADDIDTEGRTLRAVSEALVKMEKAASPMGLKVNE